MIIVGLVLGAIYAIAAAGLVITYVSTGILNFAFGAMAFAIARLYYEMNTAWNWGIIPSFVISVFVAAPLLGVALYAIVFRHLQLASQLVKIVCTIGVSVALPALTTWVFGTGAIFFTPGLAPAGSEIFEDVLWTNINLSLDQLIVLGSVALTLLVGTAVLRFTTAGLKVRALVDSQAMTGLSGTNPGRVAVGVWIVSSMVAGFAGILLAPYVNLEPGKFTLLTAAAFAAVVAARLRSVGIAVVVGLLMGIADQAVQKYWAEQGPWLKPSIPFLFIAIFLFIFVIRSGRVAEETAVGGPLDHAIRPQGGDRSVVIVEDEELPRWTRLLFRNVLPVGLIVVFALFPLVFDGLWADLVALGMGYAMIMLSYTLVTGEGGMIWLCQITFGGIGAITAATLMTEQGWPLLAAVAAAVALGAVMGMAIGALTIRLGALYVALVTLTFAILVEQLVFQREYFLRGGSGFPLPRPEFAEGDQAFSYLAIVAFCVLALIVYNVRKSTAGMALSAVRWSEPAARTLGISVVQMKMLVAGIAAAVAVIGGVFLAMFGGAAQPDLFSTFQGLVWLAVLVNFGIRSAAAAALAGVILAYMPNLLSSYLPTISLGVFEIRTGEFVPLFFGLGAILVAKNPDGVLADNARRLQARIGRRHRDKIVASSTGSDHDGDPPPAGDDAAVAPAALGGGGR